MSPRSEYTSPHLQTQEIWPSQVHTAVDPNNMVLVRQSSTSKSFQPPNAVKNKHVLNILHIKRNPHPHKAKVPHRGLFNRADPAAATWVRELKHFRSQLFLRPHDKSFDNEFFADRCANDVWVSQTLPNAELSCSAHFRSASLTWLRKNGVFRFRCEHSYVSRWLMIDRLD